MLYQALLAALAARGVTRTAGGPVVVACSGGPDSVALAHVAVKLLGPERVVLGHVDHAVRSDSGVDAALVLALAGSLGCRAEVTRLPPGPADEARLRALRYEALEALRTTVGASVVLTAHTRDDQAETVLLQLLRRTDLGALVGMPPERGALVRPWLGVPRAEVHAHVARHRLPARQDPSNAEPRYLRNRLRKELLPLLERRYRPGFAARLARLAEHLRAALPDEGASPEGVALTRPAPPPPVAPALEAPPELGPLLPIHLERTSWDGVPFPDGRSAAVFDADAVQGLVVRRVRPGERVAPFGGAGHRQVRDVLREGGIPEAWRPFCSVVADADDRILWVPGLLRSAHAKVGETTRHVWFCRVRAKTSCGAEVVTPL
ncbi:MAG: tRNA lysidine(34) synthetase TilS [Deltaproteobacteria bacterium]|nr:tRNA lysidine(34) synthetase TilS [Deltaproteobacteria bacterium]